MKKKLQVVISEEAWDLIEAIAKEANHEFKNGNINWSDVVNEMILNAKVDIALLQAKHTNIRKSLRWMASQKEINIDAVIKSLTSLKTKGGFKRAARPANESPEVAT